MKCFAISHNNSVREAKQITHFTEGKEDVSNFASHACADIFGLFPLALYNCHIRPTMFIPKGQASLETLSYLQASLFK